MSSVKSFEISTVRFIRGARRLNQLPDDEIPEIVVAGRSNVGKSSLLRELFGSRKLVRVSKTPGRTQEINLFEVTLSDGGIFRVADLPGYGYAKVPLSLKQEWGRFITEYLEARKTIRVVLVLVDGRRMLDRGLDELELSFLSWLDSLERPAALVFTKVDKVPKTRWGDLKSRARAAVGRSVPAVLFSATTGQGLDDLRRTLSRFLKKTGSSDFPDVS